ncbi:MAG TPA: hypothetical protein VF815_25200 [Myxococcaceae bacterium]|jgi:hypothetical protein
MAQKKPHKDRRPFLTPYEPNATPDSSVVEQHSAEIVATLLAALPRGDRFAVLAKALDAEGYAVDGAVAATHGNADARVQVTDALRHLARIEASHA